ncbi:MAG: PTS sugar transporter subunit IIA [Spirochaetales bacterium]|nr:PTS sugar transporter subunit IIA [Spirochaetales bacterium]
MGFLELLDKCLIKIPLEAHSKQALIEELLDLMDKNKKLLDREMAFHDVLKREALCSTGLERGIAIPHAKTSSVDDIVLAVGISEKGIDYDAMDGLPSSLFFMILAPPDKSGPHVEVLSDIAKMTKSESMCRLLRSSKNADEVIQLFED